MSSKGRLLAQAITESRVLSTALTETVETPSTFAVTQKYTTIDDLPAVGNTIGDQAFVESTNRLYIWNGNGWYNIALINTNPSFDSGGAPEASYLLELNDSGYISPLTITLLATDPEGIPIQYSALLSDSASNFISVSQDSSVFTITPKSVDSIGEYNSAGGTFSITFRASDGVNLATVLSEFTVNLATIVENSRYTTLSLKTNGVDASDNNTFVDGSTNNFTITRNGNTTQGTFSPYGDRWSNYFDGAGDSLETPPNNAIGTNPFTIECWIYPLSAAQNDAFICHAALATSSNFQFAFIDTLGSIAFYYNTNTNFTSTNTVNFNQWNHVAVTGDGSGTLRLFLNGVLENTQSYSYNYTSTIGWRVGRNRGGTVYFDGYISDLRVVNGTALYTSTFTPPTEPLTAIANTELLTCQSNRFKDNSTNNYVITPAGNVKVTKFSPYDQDSFNETVTGGSGYFDGDGDYLEIASSPWVDANSDWTIEFWVWFKNTSVNNMLFGHYSLTGNPHCFLRSGVIRFSRWDGENLDSTTQPVNNRWYHIAITYDSSTTTGKIFVDGVLENSITFGTFSTTGVFNIAKEYSSHSALSGYLADLRLVQEVLYTTNFTPPTAPLTAVANTALLCNFTNAGIYDTSTKNNLETVGNAQVDTAVTKFGTGSMYFDGTGDYLIIPYDPILNPTYSEDFTAECWVYPLNLTNVTDALVFGQNDGSVYEWAIRIIDGKANMGVSTGAVISTNLLPNNIWTHLTFSYSKNNNTIYAFENGNLVGTTVVTDWGISTIPLHVGARAASTWVYNGYIEDLRITKGLARYTSNFTPPVAPLKG